MAHRLMATILLMWMILLAAATAGYAQTTSTVEGTVKDPQGLSVAGVTVTAASSASSAKCTAVSDSRGLYRITGLPAGTYVVATAPTGSFASMTYRNVEVLLNRTLLLEIQLTVGTVKSEVEVRGVASELKTDTPDLGSNIARATIQNTPLNGRNYVDLLQLVPGVAVNRQADQGSDQADPILGERAGNTVFMIDGMSNENEFGGGASAQFNQDTIQEFQVLTTGYKAEFGHGSGGVVNVITKSGANRWHGSAFAFHRNSELDRNNSLDPTVTKPPWCCAGTLA